MPFAFSLTFLSWTFEDSDGTKSMVMFRDKYLIGSRNEVTIQVYRVGLWCSGWRNQMFWQNYVFISEICQQSPKSFLSINTVSENFRPSLIVSRITEACNNFLFVLICMEFWNPKQKRNEHVKSNVNSTDACFLAQFFLSWHNYLSYILALFDM